jgi:murein DD-endopeptidase MepM/ murein hydrolase activator NlpD
MHRIISEARRQHLEMIPCPAARPGRRTARLAAFDARQHARETIAVPAYSATARIGAAVDRVAGGHAGSAFRHLRGRARSLAGEADAVTDTSREITRLIAGAPRDSAQPPATPTRVHSALIWPAAGPLGSRFGIRHGRLHAGIDIEAPYGTSIQATADGVVLYSGFLGPYGNVTVLAHERGIVTVYAHQASSIVLEGERVAAGQPIGFVGCTGRGLGPHLHLEVRLSGEPVDPLTYIQPPSARGTAKRS